MKAKRVSLRGSLTRVRLKRASLQVILALTPPAAATNQAQPARSTAAGCPRQMPVPVQAGVDLEEVRLQMERSAKQGRAEAALLQPAGRVPISQVSPSGRMLGCFSRCPACSWQGGRAFAFMLELELRYVQHRLSTAAC